jgi:hypothetical protein
MSKMMHRGCLFRDGGRGGGYYIEIKQKKETITIENIDS